MSGANARVSSCFAEHPPMLALATVPPPCRCRVCSPWLVPCLIFPTNTKASSPPRAGCAARLPTSVTGLHWFVHSLATPLRFRLEQAGLPTVRGRALAHFEKNWGRTFPTGAPAPPSDSPG